MFETDRLPSGWSDRLNRMDEVFRRHAMIQSHINLKPNLRLSMPSTARNSTSKRNRARAEIIRQKITACAFIYVCVRFSTGLGANRLSPRHFRRGRRRVGARLCRRRIGRR